MANLGFAFDATTVEPAAPFEPLPAGDYLVQIIESAMKEPRNGGAEMAAFTLEVIEGPNANRRLWENLSINHVKPDVASNNRRTLSSMCHATGQLNIEDTSELEFIPMIARVAVSRDKVTGEWQNRIKSYAPVGDAAADAPKRAAAPAPAAAARAAPTAAARPAATRPGAGAAAPWSRKAG